MPKKIPNYYTHRKVPVKVIETPEKTKNIINFDKFKCFLKIGGQFVFALLLIVSFVRSLSAFEAHVVNVTAHICNYSENRTPGFWSTHPQLYVLPQALGYDNITDISGAAGIFNNANADEMIDQFKSHLLAMRFNIAYFGVGDYFVESENKTINDIVAEADTLLKLSQSPPTPELDPTREELEAMKNLLDELNNLHQIRACSTVAREFGLIKKMSDGVGDLLLSGNSVEITIEEPTPQPYCGDNNLDEGEECDDGNNIDNDGCSVECTIEQTELEPEPESTQQPYCGDNNLDEGEECDDGNSDEGDGCSADCLIEQLEPEPECVSEETQSCDTALLGICATGTKLCSQDSFWGECVQDNASTTEICDNQLDDDCDGTIDCNDEDCAEDLACQLEPEPEPEPESYCGDGNLDEGEECDDGNTEDGDGCSALCVIEPQPECTLEETQSCDTSFLGICAVGTQTCSEQGFWDECVQNTTSTAEICDNQLDDDCDGTLDCDDEDCAEESVCQPEPYCGDDFINGEEQCDEGENNGTECVPEYGSSCTYCSTSCEIIELTGPYCGDSNLDETEECDDGNNEDGDGCSASCVIETPES